MRKGYSETALGQFHWVDVGRGTPVVLLGPAPRSWRVFADLLPRLSEHFRVVVVEQPGTGESAPAPGASIEQVASAVGEVIASGIDAPVLLFGLHSGAKVAAALAAARPDLVSALMLCGKSHSIAPDMNLRNRATRAVVERHYFVDGAGESAGDDLSRAWKAVARNATSLLLDDALSQPSRGLLDSAASKLADTLNTRGTVLDSYRANFEFDFAAAAAAVVCQTTIVEIVSPSEDATIGRQGDMLAALMRKAEVFTLPDTDRPGFDLHAGNGAIAAAILRSFGAKREN